VPVAGGLARAAAPARESALAIVEAAATSRWGRSSSCSTRTAASTSRDEHRLQVEHPITEEVYGVDLVCEQIRLALGEPLSLRQDALAPRGHAIECRIYAEDPLRNFAPSPGRISLLIRPDGPGVRVDSGVFSGSVVPLEYDPMLAKLVVWAPDRTTALARLRRALHEYRVRGIATTLSLFRVLVDMAAFQQGDLHTGLLDELLPRVGSRSCTASRTRRPSTRP
jgi:acetyl/propionyl-CoA carboxylase alpha subunit